GISMKNNITDLKANATHVLLSKCSLLRGPLEASHNRILDFIEILHSLTHINNHVRAGGLRSKAPNLLGKILVPPKLLREDLRAHLGIITWTNASLINSLSKTLF